MEKKPGRLFFKKQTAEKAYEDALQHAKQLAVEAAERAELEAKFAGIGLAATSVVLRMLRQQQAAKDALAASAQEEVLKRAQSDLDELSAVIDDEADVEVFFDERYADLEEPQDAETKAFVAQLGGYSSEAESAATEIELLSKAFYSPLQKAKEPITLDASIFTLTNLLRANAGKFSPTTRFSTVHEVVENFEKLGIKNLVKADSLDSKVERLSPNCGAGRSGSLGGSRGAISLHACYQECINNTNCVGFDAKDNMWCYLKQVCNGTPGDGNGYRLKTDLL